MYKRQLDYFIDSEIFTRAGYQLSGGPWTREIDPSQARINNRLNRVMQTTTEDGPGSMFYPLTKSLLPGEFPIEIVFDIARGPDPEPEPEPKPKPKPQLNKPDKPVSKPKSKPKPVTKAKGTRYYVQVANCVFEDCVQDYKRLLKRHGYKSRVVKNSETSHLAEVISAQAMKDEASTKLVNSINRSNREAGHAYRKKTDGGYLVSLGLFPNLETAGRVRNFLNQAHGKDTFFDIKRGSDKITYQRVQAGGYRTKQQAESLRILLARKDKNFEGSFIVAVKR